MWRNKIRYSLKVVSFGLNAIALAVLALPIGIDRQSAIYTALVVIAIDTVVEVVEWIFMKPLEVNP